MHDGIVDRFDRSLDDYQSWLREQEDASGAAAADAQDVAPAKTVNKKQQRQTQVAERRRLKPLRDKVQSVEKALAEQRANLALLDASLSDEAIYSDQSRKDELTDLIAQQAKARTTIESLESDWLEASEQLEQATVM